MKRGFLPPEENPLKTKAKQAAKKGRHQAIQHLRSLDETGNKSHYLSYLFLELFGNGHERFGESNLHGKICGIKNRAKEISDSPYEWVIEKLFYCKKSEDFNPRSDEEANHLPFRIHKYLSSVISQNKNKVPQPNVGEKLTENQVKELVDHGYSPESFKVFRKNVDSDTKSRIYKP